MSIPEGPESIRESVRRLQQSTQTNAPPNLRNNNQFQFSGNGTTGESNEPIKGTRDGVKSQILRRVISVGSAVDFDLDEQGQEGKPEIILPGIETAMVN